LPPQSYEQQGRLPYHTGDKQQVIQQLNWQSEGKTFSNPLKNVCFGTTFHRTKIKTKDHYPRHRDDMSKNLHLGTKDNHHKDSLRFSFGY
jgi:hypothetical protein